MIGILRYIILYHPCQCCSPPGKKIKFEELFLNIRNYWWKIEFFATKQRKGRKNLFAVKYQLFVNIFSCAADRYASGWAAWKNGRHTLLIKTEKPCGAFRTAG